MITVTLNSLRAADACPAGMRRALALLPKGIGEDTLIPLADGIGKLPPEDLLWALRASDISWRDVVHFAVWCARQVQHLMDDPRSVAALDVAERAANGLATLEEVRAAADAARAAAADAAYYAARSAQMDMLRRMCNGTAPWQTEG